jgi:serine/threonine-protein kinase
MSSGLGTLGRYQLVRKIASGGMAEIWLAKAAGPGGFEKQVVLKCILPHLADDPVFIHMFLDEARVAAMLSHPHIAQVYDFGEEGGTFYLAMEAIRGPDLRRLLTAIQRLHRRIPVELCARIIAQAADALDYAHEAVDPDGNPLNIIHRDVSPQNIIVSFDGATKLVDFGVAKAAGRIHRTEAGSVKGKFAYMAPEQLDNRALDKRADVFGLGLVLYELLCGVAAYRGDSDVAVVRAASDARFDPPEEHRPDLPDELVAVLRRTLQRDREQRFQSARELQIALDAWLFRRGTPVPPHEIGDFLRSVRTESGDSLSLADDSGPKPVPRQRTPSDASVPHDGVAEANEALMAVADAEEVEEVEDAGRMKTDPDAAPALVEVSEELVDAASALAMTTDPAIDVKRLQAAIALEDDEVEPETMAVEKGLGDQPTMLRPGAAATRAFPLATDPAPPWATLPETEAEIEQRMGGGEPPVDTARLGQGRLRRMALPAVIAVASVAGLGLGSILSSNKGSLEDLLPKAPLRPEPPPPATPIPASSRGAATADPAEAPPLALNELPLSNDIPLGTGLPRTSEKREERPPERELKPAKAEARRPRRTESEPPAREVAAAAPLEPAKPPPAERHEPKPEPPPAPTPAAVAQGFLTLGSTPWTEVYLGERLLGPTPLVKLPLPAGRHDLKLVNPDKRISHNLTIQVPPGGEAKENVKLGKGRVNFRAIPWAQVSVDGQKLGLTPLPPQELYEGTYTFTFINDDTGRKESRTVMVAPDSEQVVKVDLRQTLP